jgi:hypothetical protein
MIFLPEILTNSGNCINANTAFKFYLLKVLLNGFPSCRTTSDRGFATENEVQLYEVMFKKIDFK